MAKLPDRYKQLEDPIIGGFGSVFFCEDRHLSRKVAIKFLQDGAEIRRMFDELRALLLLRSKHVVQIYDVIPSDGNAVGIVEEFVEGDDLWDSNMPRNSAENYLKTLWQIASGISDIHAADVIHRDIKPNNMKLDAEGIVKIFDFGLARKEGPKAITAGFVGTRGFAAPELYERGGVAFSKAVDTYAFGATALFLRSGALPSDALSQPPSKIGSEMFMGHHIEIPSDLAVLLQSCLEQKPEDRPDMAEVRDAIARYLLRDKHQALIVFEHTTSYLNASRRIAKLEMPSVGRIEIRYSGLDFSVVSVEGEVFVNNSPVHVGMTLPGSCVLAFGGNHRSAGERAFITFDLSNPEIVL